MPNGWDLIMQCSVSQHTFMAAGGFGPTWSKWLEPKSSIDHSATLSFSQTLLDLYNLQFYQKLKTLQRQPRRRWPPCLSSYINTHEGTHSFIKCRLASAASTPPRTRNLWQLVGTLWAWPSAQTGCSSSLETHAGHKCDRKIKPLCVKIRTLVIIHPIHSEYVLKNKTGHHSCFQVLVFGSQSICCSWASSSHNRQHD